MRCYIYPVLIKRYIKRKLGMEHSAYTETLHGLWDGIKWTWQYDCKTLPVILNKIPKRTKICKIN